jgi:hypothetical protein
VEFSGNAKLTDHINTEHVTWSTSTWEDRDDELSDGEIPDGDLSEGEINDLLEDSSNSNEAVPRSGADNHGSAPRTCQQCQDSQHFSRRCGECRPISKNKCYTCATLVIARNTGKGIAGLDPRLGRAANKWPRGWSIRITSRWQNWMTRPPHQPARSLGQNQYGGLPRHRHCHGPQTLPLNLYQWPWFCPWERIIPRRNAVSLPPVRRPQRGLRHPWQKSDHYPDPSNAPASPVGTTRPMVEKM